MGDIFSEILKAIIFIVIWFAVAFSGGFLYGVNKKFGIIVGLLFVALLGTALLLGSYLILTSNVSAGDFSWGSALGGFFGGQISISSYKSGISAAKTIKENWKK